MYVCVCTCMCVCDSVLYLVICIISSILYWKRHCSELLCILLLMSFPDYFGATFWVISLTLSPNTCIIFIFNFPELFPIFYFFYVAFSSYFLVVICILSFAKNVMCCQYCEVLIFFSKLCLFNLTSFLCLLCFELQLIEDSLL